MRILFVSEDLPAPLLAGAAIHAVLLANALIDAGHEVQFLVRGDVTNAPGDQGFRGRLHRGIDFRHTGWKELQSGIFNPLRRPHMARRIRSAIDAIEGAWDVVHYHGHFPELGAMMPTTVNFVQTLHDQGSECITKSRFRSGQVCDAREPSTCAGCATAKPNVLQTLVTSLAVKAHREAAHVAFTKHSAICVSDFLARRCREILGSQTELNLSVVHGFIDGNRLRELAKAHVPVSRGSSDRPRIFMVGRIDQAKGFSAFLSSLSESEINRLDIRIGGLGPDFERLKSLYCERGVAFLGWLDYSSVVDEILRADIAVVPSVWEEPFGTTTLEALALGRRVFALNRGGTPELNKYTAGDGQLCLFGDSAELAKAVASLTLPQPQWPVSAVSDVQARLPEILAVYRARLPMTVAE